MGYRYQLFEFHTYLPLTKEERMQLRSQPGLIQVFHEEVGAFRIHPRYQELLDGVFQPPPGSRIVSFAVTGRWYSTEKVVVMLEYDDVPQGHPYRV